MKKLLTFLFFFNLATILIQAQCNISTTENDQGNHIFTAQKESIYDDKRYEDGILSILLQLEAIQHPIEKTKLMFYMHAWSLRKGNKPMIVPRQINIDFVDGTFLNLTAEVIHDNRIHQGVSIYVCDYQISLRDYSILQEKSIEKIKVLDNRSGESISTSPYKDILKEQASCITKKITVDISSDNISSNGTFVDNRDGQSYKWVKIDGNYWMAENLNFQTENSWCYDNDSNNCKKYGRLYTIQSASEACPDGWRLPTNEELQELMLKSGEPYCYGCAYRAGNDLKSVYGWKKKGGINKYGFNALPSGLGDNYMDTFSYIGEACYFWSVSSSSPKKYYRWMITDLSSDVYFDEVDYDFGRFSIRCIKD